MKTTSVIVALLALASFKHEIAGCTIEYDSGKKFASVCNHYIKVDNKKFTIIDNGCIETRISIIEKLRKNQCNVSLTFDSYREDWASK